MYRRKEETKQQEFVDFYLMLGGKLDPENKWIRLAQIIPWGIYEIQYAQLFSNVTGAPAKPFRVALEALLIKTTKGITDEAVAEELKENPYLQYLIGLKAYHYEVPFDASMMVHFRKRIRFSPYITFCYIRYQNTSNSNFDKL